MVDVSSGGAAFTCHSIDGCPYSGQRLTARFSLPRFGGGESFDMASFVRPAEVCRVEQLSPFVHKVAVKFSEVLPLKPGEQVSSENEANERMMEVVI